MSLHSTKTETRSLEADKTRRLIDALRGGTDLETASAFAGYSLAQVIQVIAAGQAESDRIDAGIEPNEANTDALLLWREVYKARAEVVVRAVAQIQKAANQGEWKAAAWWLERSLPDKYGANRPEKALARVFEYRCPEGHVIAVTQESQRTCGICNTPMSRV